MAKITAKRGDLLEISTRVVNSYDIHYGDIQPSKQDLEELLALLDEPTLPDDKDGEKGPLYGCDTGESSSSDEEEDSGFFVIRRNIEDRRYRINNNTFKYRCTKKSIRYLTINIKDREPVVLEKMMPILRFLKSVLCTYEEYATESRLAYLRKDIIK